MSQINNDTCCTPKPSYDRLQQHSAITIDSAIKAIDSMSKILKSRVIYIKEFMLFMLSSSMLSIIDNDFYSKLLQIINLCPVHFDYNSNTYRLNPSPYN